MVNSVATINSLLAQFQTVNTAIMKGTATGADISDVLDQRNTILQSLSQQIGVTTTTNSNGSMSIYTDSGATLFDITPRSVTMTPTTAYTASTTGAAVYVDGVPVTGANAVMPIQSGALAGSPICATMSRRNISRSSTPSPAAWSTPSPKPTRPPAASCAGPVHLLPARPGFGIVPHFRPRRRNRRSAPPSIRPRAARSA